jgi:hypothetical protein
VVPSLALQKTSYLFSGGYGNDFSFERDFLHRYSVTKVILYDFSITLSSLVIELMRASRAVLLRRDHYPIFNHLKNIFTYISLMFTRKIFLVHKKLSTQTDETDFQVSDLKTAFNSISTENQELFFSNWIMKDMSMS